MVTLWAGATRPYGITDSSSNLRTRGAGPPRMLLFKPLTSYLLPFTCYLLLITFYFLNHLPQRLRIQQRPHRYEIWTQQIFLVVLNR